MSRRPENRGGRRGPTAGGHGPQGRARDHRPEKPSAAAPLNVAYGIHAVRALLVRHPQRVRQVWTADGRESSPRLDELRALAQQAGVDTGVADQAQLDRLAGGERHQGAVAEIVPRAGDPETQLEEALEAVGTRRRCCWCWTGSPIRTTSARACAVPMRPASPQ